jgi:hypothetical protein
MYTGPSYLGASFVQPNTLLAQSQRLNFLHALYQALVVAAGKYSIMPLGIDISANCGDLDDEDFLAFYEGGVRWIGMRASSGWQQSPGSAYDVANYVDVKFSSYLNSAFKAKLMSVPYHYLKFDVPQAGSAAADWGFRALEYALQGKTPGLSYHAVGLDVEDQSNTNTNTQIYLNTFYGWMLKSPKINGLAIPFYSSPGYLNKYTAVRDWLGPVNPTSRKMIWLAQWIRNATPLTEIDWNNIEYPSYT